MSQRVHDILTKVRDQHLDILVTVEGYNHTDEDGRVDALQDVDGHETLTVDATPDGYLVDMGYDDIHEGLLSDRWVLAEDEVALERVVQRWVAEVVR